jgi:hypothetical protein
MYIYTCVNLHGIYFEHVNANKKYTPCICLFLLIKCRRKNLWIDRNRKCNAFTWITTILQNFILLLCPPSDFAVMAIHGKIWALFKKIYTYTMSGCIFPSFLKMPRNLTNFAFSCIVGPFLKFKYTPWD